MSAFARPTLDDLRTRARAQFAAHLPGVDPTLRRSPVNVTADVVASMSNSELGYIDWIVDNVFMPDSATAEYLDRWLRTYGMARKAASYASGPALIISGVAGAPIPAGTIYQTTDGTVEFETQATVSLAVVGAAANATASVAITAITAGTVGNLLPGATLLLQTALPGVYAQAVLGTAGTTGATDIETDPAAQARLQQRIANPPQGGAPMDYVIWTKDGYASATRAWCFPLLGGSPNVGVTFVCDGRSSIVATGTDITAVQAALAPLVPVTAAAQVFATPTQIVNITLANLIGNSAALQAAINAELADLFATIAPGGAVWGDGVSAANPGGYLSLNQISAAISQAVGVTRFDLTAPTADIIAGQTTLLALGTVTF